MSSVMAGSVAREANRQGTHHSDLSVCKLEKSKDFYCGRDCKQENFINFI